jgi:hypothetical protein
MTATPSLQIVIDETAGSRACYEQTYSQFVGDLELICRPADHHGLLEVHRKDRGNDHFYVSYRGNLNHGLPIDEHVEFDPTGKELARTKYGTDGKGNLCSTRQEQGSKNALRTAYFANGPIVRSRTELNGVGKKSGLRTVRDKSGALIISRCNFKGRDRNFDETNLLVPSFCLKAALLWIRMIDNARFAFGCDHKTPSERADAQVNRATFGRAGYAKLLKPPYLMT